MPENNVNNGDVFYEYSINGNDIKTYILLRKGLVHETVQKMYNAQSVVNNKEGTKVSLTDGWVAFELGTVRLIQYSSKQDTKTILVANSNYGKGHAIGRTSTAGRIVVRNTDISMLEDLKRRILSDDRFSIKVSSEGFGVDFEDEITYDEVNDAQPIENSEDISWADMPSFDILLVASDPREIEKPRVFRFKDVSIGDIGSSEGATDTEENEFFNFTALSGYTPWRVLERK